MFKTLYNLFRIKHWVKNLFIFLPLLFSINFFKPEYLIKSIFIFIAFCLAASAIYIINDVFDKTKDQLHPIKKKRPIAAKQISIQIAFFISFILLFFSIVISFYINTCSGLILFLYVIINILYSKGLKNCFLLDIIIIASGFVFRILIGAYAINVPISHWILLTTFFAALFIALSKRRFEFINIGNHDQHRPSLKLYNLDLINYFSIIAVALTIISYSLWSIDEQVIQRFQTDKLIYTIPFIIYGLFKYLQLVLMQEKGSDPVDAVLADKSLITVFLLWLISVISIIYLPII